MIASRTLVKPNAIRVAAPGPAKAADVAIAANLPAAHPTAAAREAMIREAAYFRAERRAFAPGGELEDWFAAERQVDGALIQSTASAAAPASAEERSGRR